MPAFVCATCAVQYPPSQQPPAECPICTDSRQYVGWAGQQWTTLEELRRDHRNEFTEEEPGLTSILPTPTFGIGQRAFLVQTTAGNVLWDCVPLLDDDTMMRVKERGGITAMAISHPHYYSAMAEWSRAFGDVPVYVHEADREWVMRPENVVFWSGDTHELRGGFRLVHCGGHFDGYQVAVWNGALLAGDQPQVAMDRKSVSFLYSYPNMIPLGSKAVRRIVEALEPYEFDRLYGAFSGRTIRSGAKDVVRWSAERYLRFISE